jgi:Protein of unknown function (DUF1501)
MRRAEARSGDLPLVLSQRSATRDARSSYNGLRDLALALPVTPQPVASVFPNLPAAANIRDLQVTMEGIELGLLAFKTGQAISLNMSIGFFDTHSTHYANHPLYLAHILMATRYVIQKAEELGLSDRLYLVVGWEFGRTPKLNMGQGKDHWNVTSTLLAGPGIRGGRTLGGTDEALRPLKVNPADLSEPAQATDDSGWTRITPTHVQRALRKLTGLEASPHSDQYPLPLDAGHLPLDDMLG